MVVKLLSLDLVSLTSQFPRTYCHCERRTYCTCDLLHQISQNGLKIIAIINYRKRFDNLVGTRYIGNEEEGLT